MLPANTGSDASVYVVPQICLAASAGRRLPWQLHNYARCDSDKAAVERLRRGPRMPFLGSSPYSRLLFCSVVRWECLLERPNMEKRVRSKGRRVEIRQASHRSHAASSAARHPREAAYSIPATCPTVAIACRNLQRLAKVEISLLLAVLVTVEFISPLLQRYMGPRVP